MADFLIGFGFGMIGSCFYIAVVTHVNASSLVVTILGITAIPWVVCHLYEVQSLWIVTQ